MMNFCGMPVVTSLLLTKNVTKTFYFPPRNGRKRFKRRFRVVPDETIHKVLDKGFYLLMHPIVAYELAKIAKECTNDRYY